VGLGNVAAAAGSGEYGRALGRAIARATACASPADAMRSLFKPSDTVGIKVNCLAGPRMSPRPELVEALAELVAGAGVERTSIIVFERSSRELDRAGFTVRRKGGPFLCYGIDNDFDRRPTESGSIGSCFARLVSTTCSALISVGVVKDHDFAGVSAGLKNWYGVIHNPNKYHDNNCDPYVVDVLRAPFLGPKVRLTVLDGTMAQYRGGPAYFKAGEFGLGVVAASTDGVAADAWAWREIDRERSRRALPSLAAEARAPAFIGTAARAGLGCGDRNSLEVVGP
jgi:uncharacterized protein (DUF362 family)